MARKRKHSNVKKKVVEALGDGANSSEAGQTDKKDEQLTTEQYLDFFLKKGAKNGTKLGRGLGIVGARPSQK